MNMRIYLSVLVNAAIAGLCSSAESPPPSTTGEKPPVVTYPYEMPPGRKKDFTEKFKLLERGQPLEEVVKLLGPPFRREGISAKEHDRPLGTQVTYYVRKLYDGVNLKYDQHASLRFGTDNRLVEVLSNNLVELSQGVKNIPVLACQWDDKQKNVVTIIQTKDDSRSGEIGGHR
jgi:hypothetical protein